MVLTCCQAHIYMGACGLVDTGFDSRDWSCVLGKPHIPYYLCLPSSDGYPVDENYDWEAQSACMLVWCVRHILEGRWRCWSGVCPVPGKVTGHRYHTLNYLPFPINFEIWSFILSLQTRMHSWCVKFYTIVSWIWNISYEICKRIILLSCTITR